MNCSGCPWSTSIHVVVERARVRSRIAPAWFSSEPRPTVNELSDAGKPIRTPVARITTGPAEQATLDRLNTPTTFSSFTFVDEVQPLVRPDLIRCRWSDVCQARATTLAGNQRISKCGSMMQPRLESVAPPRPLWRGRVQLDRHRVTGELRVVIRELEHFVTDERSVPRAGSLSTSRTCQRASR